MTSSDVRSVIERPARDGGRDPRRRRAVGRPRHPRRPRRRSLGARSRTSSIESPRASASIVDAARRADEVRHHLHRADALRRVAGDIGSRLDLDRILSRPRRARDGPLRRRSRRGVPAPRPTAGRPPRSAAACRRPTSSRSRDFPARSLPSLAVAARRPMFAGGYRDDPRGEDVRAAVVQEGFDTICTAPLFDGADAPRPAQRLPRRAARLDRRRARHDGGARDPGVGRDQERPELREDGDLGRPAPVDPAAGRAAVAPDERARDRPRDRDRAAPAHRLPQRPRLPARRRGPASRSRCRARSASTSTRRPSSSQVKFGQGITGWVAEHRVAQNLPDAAQRPPGEHDPGHRGRPRRVDAPRPDDRSRTRSSASSSSRSSGLHQFSDDDLRLLVIYASFAAQAFANADATEPPPRPVGGARAAAREPARPAPGHRVDPDDARSPARSSTRSPTASSDLVGYDNLAIEIVDPVSGLLRPLTAQAASTPTTTSSRGRPARRASRRGSSPTTSRLIVVDERNDARVNHFRDGAGRRQPDLRAAARPRGRDRRPDARAARPRAPLHEEEFELVQLFAAQVSIALQNAEVHRAVEIRAQTDDLTGLLNHGTFQDWLRRSVDAPRAVQPDHARPRRLQGRQRRARPPGRRPAARGDLAGDRRRRPRHRPRLPVRRRRVRPASCPAPTRRRRSASPSGSGRPSTTLGEPGLELGRRGDGDQRLDRPGDVPARRR